MRTSVEFILIHDEASNVSKRFPITDGHGELDVEKLLPILREGRTVVEVPKRLVEEILLEAQALRITKITLDKVIRELKGGRKMITEEVANVYWDTLERIRNLDGLRVCDLGFSAMKYLENQQKIQLEVDQATAEFEKLAKEIRQEQRQRNENIIQF